MSSTAVRNVSPSSALADEKTLAGNAGLLPFILAAFCASGFAAILYQVVWQRVLFASFGVNVQAVTVVVTAFLAGLGLGSIWGGYLSYGSSAVLLRRFGSLEVAVGLFGLISLPFFQRSCVGLVLPSAMPQ